jgi:hypothetical protein
MDEGHRSLSFSTTLVRSKLPRGDRIPAGDDPAHIHRSACNARLRTGGNLSFRIANGTATTSGNEYIAKAGTLIFAPGETTKTITIEVIGDNKKTHKTFRVDLTGLSPDASGFTKNRGIDTTLNDD